MLPLILISRQSNKTEDFIKTFVQEYTVPSYNVFIISPAKTELSIDQIRLLKKELIHGTTHTRLFILQSFDSATLEAQNALLKTLEEKKGKDEFILVADNLEKILPTIRSRSKTIFLDKNDEILVNENKKIIELLTNLENQNNFSFIADSTVSQISKENAVIFFDTVIMHYRKKLSEDMGKKIPAVIKKAFELKNLLTQNNLNPQLTVDNFLIFLKKHLQN